MTNDEKIAAVDKKADTWLEKFKTLIGKAQGSRWTGVGVVVAIAAAVWIFVF